MRLFISTKITAIKVIKGCHKVYAVHQEGVYVVQNLFPSPQFWYETNKEHTTFHDNIWQASNAVELL